ncbi:peptidase S8/S53 domain-containing protein [Infundibulicybe gibba]|nr:peptidase S8/S53 domain-containing protein [Infundibulicybe gibba]
MACMLSRILALFISGCLLAATAFGVAAQLSPYRLHESRSSIPHGWKPIRRHSSTASLPLRLGLAQSNLDQLDAFLNDVSHPESPNYGAHWTPEKIANTFAPSTEALAAVRAWLGASGLAPTRVRVSPTKGWIEVNTTTEEAENLLKAEYHVYEHGSGKQHIACTAYHLPAHIAPHVEIVTPTIHFNAILHKRGGHTGVIARPAPGLVNGHPISGPVSAFGGSGAHKSSGNATADALVTCDQEITPACIRALYGLNRSPSSPQNNTVGIVEYTPQAYLQSDLDMFAAIFSQNMVGQSPKLVSIDGGVVQNLSATFSLNGESSLDLQYAMALVNPTGTAQAVTLYQAGDLPAGATFNNFLDALDGSFCTYDGGDDVFNDAFYPDEAPGGYDGPPDCGTTRPANIISTSYIRKLGLMGVTVLYSSGDHGVAGNSGYCLDALGDQSPDGTIFNPSFPSSCPYVTSVGATQMIAGSSTTDPEQACESVIVSGGGFSNYFDLPAYQRDAVNGYVENFAGADISAGAWNSSGNSRAFPDISANGANYIIAVDGVFYLVFGTSAAAPVVASILTLVNDARITAGKSPIGFINPTIYSAAFKGAFNDITAGANAGCGTPGFSAAPGWDPVTGLGTPNFPKLVQQWLELP